MFGRFFLSLLVLIIGSKSAHSASNTADSASAQIEPIGIVFIFVIALVIYSLYASKHKATRGWKALDHISTFILFAVGLLAAVKSLSSMAGYGFLHSAPDVTVILFGLLSAVLAMQFGRKIPEQHEQILSTIRDSNTDLAPRFIHEKARAWELVLADVRHAQTSINVFVSTPDFSSPNDQWDTVVISQLKENKCKNNTVEYRVVIGRKEDDIDDESTKRLNSVINLYEEAGLNWVVHKFIKTEQYLGINLVIIDGLHAIIIWNATGGNHGSDALYFTDCPDLASRLDSWYQTYILN